MHTCKKQKIEMPLIGSRETKNRWCNWKLMGKLNICYVSARIPYSNCTNAYIYFGLPDTMEKYFKIFAMWKIREEIISTHTNYGEGFCR